MIAFHLSMIPPKTTSQTKRLMIVSGKPRFFPKKEHAEAENELLLRCLPYVPSEPLKGPLRLKVDFVFPWRQRDGKRRREWGKLPNDTRPDCDNLVKLVADVLTKLRFYGDDGQVAVLQVSKSWGDRVGIAVEIENLTNI